MGTQNINFILFPNSKLIIFLLLNIAVEKRICIDQNTMSVVLHNVPFPPDNLYFSSYNLFRSRSGKYIWANQRAKNTIYVKHGLHACLFTNLSKVFCWWCLVCGWYTEIKPVQISWTCELIKWRLSPINMDMYLLITNF